VSEPRDPDPVADPVGRDVAAHEVDAADDLMPGNDWISDAGKLRIENMKIGPTDSTRTHLDTNLPAAGNGISALLELEGSPRGR
jgi:hypothetical protein